MEKLSPFTLSNRSHSRLLQELSAQNLDKHRGDTFRYSLQESCRVSTLTNRRAVSESITFSELPLFPPFERAFGLHPDIQNVTVSISLSSRPLEERLLFFRTVKFPTL